LQAHHHSPRPHVRGRSKRNQEIEREGLNCFLQIGFRRRFQLPWD
jgi:hypothetical protein